MPDPVPTTGSPQMRHDAFMRENAAWDRKVQEALEELSRIADNSRFSDEYLGNATRVWLASLARNQGSDDA